jgi:hypothetical protein
MSAPFRVLGRGELVLLFQMPPWWAPRPIDGMPWAMLPTTTDPVFADLAAGFSSPYAGPRFMVLPLGGTLGAMTGNVDYAPAFGTLA